jgi:hypothetical protein
MLNKTKLAIVMVAACTLAACGEIDLRGPRKPDPGPPAEVSGPPGKVASTLRIPPGHLPPVGQCRIWKPGAPPGHQGRSGDCDALSARVPPGAWLIARRQAQPGRVVVEVYDASRTGVVSRRATFDAANGAFVEGDDLDE